MVECGNSNEKKNDNNNKQTKQNKKEISFSPETWDKMYFWPQLFKSWSHIHWINHYPTDKCYGNKLRYPVDSDLSGG